MGAEVKSFPVISTRKAPVGRLRDKNLETDDLLQIMLQWCTLKESRQYFSTSSITNGDGRREGSSLDSNEPRGSTTARRNALAIKLCYQNAPHHPLLHKPTLSIGRSSSHVIQTVEFYIPVYRTSGKSGPKDQVALHYYYTSPSHWCTTHEVSKL